jgi:hypothetical protein
MRTDSWIVQPVAFWSSLAYLVPAILLPSDTKEVRLFKWCLVSLTVASLFCHASFITLSVAMDFAGIGLVIGFFPLVRLLKGKKLYPAFILFFIVEILVNYYLTKWPKIAISVVIFIFALKEVFGTFGSDFWKSRSLQLSLIILTLSFGVFLLDDQKIFFCDHSGWFAGHTLWHYGTAWSAYYFSKWRFIDERSRLPSVAGDLH